MVRAAFYNKTLVNLLKADAPTANTLHVPTGDVLPIFEAANRYRADGDSVVLIAGERYGTGSSRDWAAKGQRLLGIRAVLAVSFERIHRSNLIGMGILPLRLIVGARSFSGNPYDGHTLAEQLEQTRILLENVPGEPKPKTVLADLGFRGVDAELGPVQLIHRGKHKTLTNPQRRWLKRRQAIEPIIGHLKQDHGMRPCWLKGQSGDALHAVLCATGYNLRWLLRAIVRLGLTAVFLCSPGCAASSRTPHYRPFNPSGVRSRVRPDIQSQLRIALPGEFCRTD
ncbi:Aconitate hydratase [Caballeronia sordidicola]|uniref:Aconitate hydratase n=1 Tax=Caballeronia sordidicola TaxID=196367 RepID=A0A242M5N0_CABSO|nr:Aconitate hydratase [Caballeronia sordidicola]